MKTEIPVTIYTGYEYEEGDAATNHRQQIEKLGFYIASVFNLLKRSAELAETEAEGNYELLNFLEDVGHLSEIGIGLAEAIFKPVSELESLSKAEAKEDE